MFVFNINFTKNRIIKFVTVIALMLLVCIVLFLIFKRKSSARENTTLNEIPSLIEITDDNYATILDSCYRNLDSYLGKKIKYNGFIFRLYDFSEKQFVLGREMIVSQDLNGLSKAVVIGFLCESNESSKFSDGTWVTVEGTITKGYYHSEIPMIDITSINESDCPVDTFVSTPSFYN